MKILVFSGTTEGKEICSFLNELCIETTVSTATEYGLTLMEDLPYVKKISGRMQPSDMKKIINEYDMVIDATHPYAVLVTNNIFTACSGLNKRYVRLLREDTFCPSDNDKIYTVSSVKEAAALLKEKSKGSIFVSTGSKELKEYSIIDNYKERIIARVLPLEESVNTCKELGIIHTIFEKGPFSYEQNIQHFSKENASWLVTKSAGNNGGFDEKIEAAKKLRMNIIVILRPEEKVKGLSLNEVKELIRYENNQGWKP